MVQETVDKKPSPRESILLHFVFAFFLENAMNGGREEGREGGDKEPESAVFARWHRRFLQPSVAQRD